MSRPVAGVLLALIVCAAAPVASAQAPNLSALALTQADVPDDLRSNPAQTGPQDRGGTAAFQATFEGDPRRATPGAGAILSISNVLALPREPAAGLDELLQDLAQSFPGPVAPLPPPPIGDEGRAFTAAASIGPFAVSLAGTAFRRNTIVGSVVVLSAGDPPQSDLSLRLAQVADARALAAVGAGRPTAGIPPAPPAAVTAPSGGPPSSAPTTALGDPPAPPAAPAAPASASPPLPSAAASVAPAPGGGSAAALSLVGQSTAGCRAGVPFDAVVELVDQAPGRDGALELHLVVRVANAARQPTRTYLATQLVDERGRRFDQAVGGITASGSPGELGALAQQYGAEHPSSAIAPGATARHLWVFTVPPDVQTLTVAPDRLVRC